MLQLLFHIYPPSQSSGQGFVLWNSTAADSSRPQWCLAGTGQPTPPAGGEPTSGYTRRRHPAARKSHRNQGKGNPPEEKRVFWRPTAHAVPQSALGL